MGKFLKMAKPVNPQKVYDKLKDDDQKFFLELAATDPKIHRDKKTGTFSIDYIFLDPKDGVDIVFYAEQEVWNNLVARFLWRLKRRG